MRPAELRRLSDEELAAELKKARDELFNVRFQLATRQLKDHAVIRRTRRTVALILTVRRERQMERQGRAEPFPPAASRELARAAAPEQEERSGA